MGGLEIPGDDVDTRIKILVSGGHRLTDSDKAAYDERQNAKRLRLRVGGRDGGIYSGSTLHRVRRGARCLGQGETQRATPLGTSLRLIILCPRYRLILRDLF